MTETDEQQIEQKLESILHQVHGTDTNQELDIQTLELAKIIVMELLNDHNLDSLSLISQAQIEDITNARLLNEYFQLDEIDNYIYNYLSLKRSSGGFMVGQLTKLGTIQTFEEQNNSKGFLSSVFRR